MDAAPNLDIVLNETIPVLEEYVQAGKARFIGVTAYDVDVLKECAERGKGRIQVVLNYARYTLLDNTLLRYMKDFQKMGVGVVCAAAHSLGLLRNAGPHASHPGSQEILAVAKRGPKSASRGTWSWESWPCTIRCNWMGRPPSSSASPTESCCGLTWTRSSTVSLPMNRKCCSICAKSKLANNWLVGFGVTNPAIASRSRTRPQPSQTG